MIWTGRGELGVKFLSTIPCHWTYAGSKIDIEKIMSWANEWRSDGAIPKFTLVRDPKTPADINVEFTCELICLEASSHIYTLYNCLFLSCGHRVVGG